MENEKSMAEKALEQFEKGPAPWNSGWHPSNSDSNEHLSIKNADKKVIGHFYKDGIIKGTNEDGSGALSWLLK